MNPKLEQELEEQISRALRGWPDLAAPPGFLARTMNALERPALSHARTWNKWPVPVQIAFFFAALATVVVVVTGWHAVEPGLLAAAYRVVGPALSGVRCFWNVLGALGGAVALGVEHLNRGFLVVCVVAALSASALCAGFGTIFVRLALARPRSSSL
jgi:hypothetical protein